jgi:hypothetical protein
MEVTAEFTPSGWKQSPGWRIKHDDCEHRVTTVRDYPQAFVEHMLDEHGKKVKPTDVSLHFLVYGTDVTALAKQANDARATAEKADRDHKRIRAEVALSLRNTAPDDRPPFPYDFIGQLLNYEQSSVLSLLRTPVTRPKGRPAKAKDK